MKRGERGREQEVCSFHVIFKYSAVFIFLMLVVILFYVFLLFYVRERSDSYFDSFELWVANSFFSKIFLPFPFLPIIPIFIRKAKKTGNGRRHHLFLFYYVLCLCFYYGPRKGDFLRLVLGYWSVGHGFWIGFSFLIPSCTFFLLPFYLLYLS